MIVRRSGARWAVAAAMVMLFAAPAAADTAVVQNIGSAVTVVDLGEVDVGQSFVTGPAAEGYKVSSIDIRFHKDAVDPNASTNVQLLKTGLNAQNMNNPPTDIWQFSFEGERGSSSVFRFTAPAGVVLQPNKKYTLTLEDGRSLVDPIRTTATAETSPDGWTIDNDRWQRTVNAIAWVPSPPSPGPLEMRVNARAMPLPPRDLISTNSSHPTNLHLIWSPPAVGAVAASPITGYVMRYFQGTSPPADASKWIPMTDDSVHVHESSATITGLKASTNYLVEVKAENEDGGLWASLQTTTAGASPATIERVSVASYPSFDADGVDGNETYVKGDTILVDVDFNEAVEVVRGTGTNGWPSVDLDMGTDGSGASRTMTWAHLDSNAAAGSAVATPLNGGRTLRFKYDVDENDVDADGIWVRTLGTVKRLFRTSGASKIRSVDTGTTVNIIPTSLPTTGGVLEGAIRGKVDGSKTNGDIAGPRPIAAAVNGKNLTVAFDKVLNTSTSVADGGSTHDLKLYIAITGAGDINGGNRGAAQHPQAVSVDGSNLRMTLGSPARSGQTVTVTYRNVRRGFGVLRGTDGAQSPAFSELEAVNSTPCPDGTAGGTCTLPQVQRVSVTDRVMELVFDVPLAETTTPGSAFSVLAQDTDADRRTILGTGDVKIRGTKAEVVLESALQATERAGVSYTKPDTGALASKTDTDGTVASFVNFLVETVYDTTPPKMTAFATSRIDNLAGRKVFRTALYFDELLGENSPLTNAGTDGTLTIQLQTFAGTEVTADGVNAHASGSTVILEYSPQTKNSSRFTKATVEYAPGDSKVRGEDGNIVLSLDTGWMDITNPQRSTKPKPALIEAEPKDPHVDGATVTLTFDEPLNAFRVPRPAQFKLYLNCEEETEDGNTYTVCDWTGSIARVALSGPRVLLTLTGPVLPCDAAFKVDYTVPAPQDGEGNPDPDLFRIQGLDGAAADGFTGKVVRNSRSEQCTTAAGASASSSEESDGGSGLGSVALRLGTSLDTQRRLQTSSFAVKSASAQGSPRVSAATYGTDGKGVVLELTRHLQKGEQAELEYSAPRSGDGLWDTGGRQIANFEDIRIAVPDPGPPSTTGVMVSSSPAADETYVLGEMIRVTVSFDDTMVVTGTPRLRIDMDPANWGLKWADYESGSGTNDLVFAFEVVEPNTSTQGIAVVANSLELNGGSIKSSSQLDAQLAHNGLGHDPNHKVDWATTPDPLTVDAVSISSSPAENGTYALSEVIRVSLTLSEAADVTGSPRLKIDMDSGDGGEKWATYESGTGTASLVFAYTVAEPDSSTQGIAVLGDSLELNGGEIQTPSGVDADLSHDGLGHDSNHKVDWQYGRATVTGVSLSSSPSEGDTYYLNETVRVAVSFSEAVNVTGAPRLQIGMTSTSGDEAWAAYESGSGTSSVTFAYTVSASDASTEGVAVTGNSLELNGGTISSSGLNADLSHAGVGHSTGHKVNGSQSAPSPTVSGLAMSSQPSGGGTYALAEVIRVQVMFSEAVAVSGTPRLRLDLTSASGGEKWVNYESGSGTASLTFAYSVASSDVSTEGVAVTASSLELAGGSIRSVSEGVNAELAHSGLGHDSNHKVDWQYGAPAITGVAVVSSPELLATYALGEVIRVTASFDDTVNVTGSPRLEIKMDPGYGEKWAVYESGGGGNSLVFAYEVVQPDESPQGIAVVGKSLELNGGAIRSSTTQADANLAHGGLGHDPNHKVDWALDVVPPEFVSAEVDGGVARVFFDEDVTMPDTSGFMALTSWAIDVSPGSFHPNSISVAGSVVTLHSAPVRPGQTLKVLYEPWGGLADLAGNLVNTAISEPAENLTTTAMSVTDARVEEAEGATLDFVAVLDVAPGGPLTVDYSTADGTASAGEDYTATSGTVTFGAGEQTKTIQVAVLDDAHDEGEETMTLQFSNPSAGIRLNRTEATGTIENADLMPAALLARFGRATAEQVVATVEDRMTASRERGLRVRFAGQEYRTGREREFALGFVRQFTRTNGSMPADGMTPVMGMGTHGGGGELMGQQMPMDGAGGIGGLGYMGDGGLLGNSEFELNQGGLSLWSRSTRSNFTGAEDALSLNGDVRTSMFGADYMRGPLTVGLSVGRTMGLGGYSGDHSGEMTTSMTGVYPWAGYQVSDRVSVWGVVGYGKGSLSLTPGTAAALETGVTMAMTAVGTRGELVETGGFSLAFKGDAMWVGAASDLLDGPTGRLNASEAGVTRVRTALEGSRGFRLGRLSLTPSVEVGLRRDGGDAETGAGMDLGGGFSFSDTVTGLSLDVRVRTLVVHQAEGFAERGMSLSFGWDPTPSSPLGLNARLAPSWGGQAQGGAEALWGNQAYGLGSQAYGGGGVNAEIGYGLPVGKRLVGTPRIGVMSSQYGRDLRLGYGLGLMEMSSLHLEAGVDATRREAVQSGVSNGVLGRLSIGW